MDWLRKWFREYTPFDLVLFAVLLGPVTMFSVGDKMPSLFWADILLAALTCHLLIKSSIKRGGTSQLRLPKGAYWALLYVAVTASTIIMAADLLRSIAVWKLRVMPAFAFILAYNHIKSKSAVFHQMRSLIIFALILSAWMMLNWYFYRSGMMILPEGMGAKDMVQVSWGRSNYLASILILLLPLTIGVGLQNRFLSIIATVCLGFSLVSTMSRGAIISLAFGLAIWCLMDLTSLREKGSSGILLKILLALILVIALIKLVIPEDLITYFLLDRFLNLYGAISDPFTLDRVQKAQEAWQGFMEHPIFGVGIGNQGCFLSGFGEASAHNLYLETLLETGLLGFIPLTAFLIICGSSAFMLYKRSRTREEHLLAGAVLTSYVGALLNASQEPSFWGVQYTYIFWLILAVPHILLREHLMET